MGHSLSFYEERERFSSNQLLQKVRRTTSTVNRIGGQLLLQPFDALRVRLFTANRVCDTGGDLGAGILGTRPQSRRFAFCRHGPASRTAGIGHANFYPIAFTAEGGKGKQKQESHHEDGDNNADSVQKAKFPI